MGDILKEFKIIFGLDNTPLEKGIKQSSASLTNFGKLFGGIVASYFSYEIFNNVINGFVNFNNELRYNTALLGGNVEKITALGGALQRFGGDTNSVITALDSINNALNDAKQGGGALVEVAQRFGVAFSPFANAEDTLESLSKQLGNYSREQRKAIAESLGFDRALTIAFADGGEELSKLIQKQKELGSVTEEDLRISKEFNNAFLDLKDIFGALMRDFSRAILPAFTKLVSIFVDFISFLRKHKTLVVGFFAGLLVALSPILIAFAKMAIASAAAFAPIYAVIGVVTALSLILEDIYFYFMGWDSVTSDLVKKFPFLASALEIIKPIVLGIFETFNKILEFLQNPSWDNFKNIFKTIGLFLVDFINKPLKLSLDLVNKLIGKFPLLAPLLKPLKIIIESIKETFNYIVDLVKNFSFENIIKGFENLKEIISGGLSSFFDKLNPFADKNKENKEVNNNTIRENNNNTIRENNNNTIRENNNNTIRENKEVNNNQTYKEILIKEPSLMETPAMPLQNTLNNSNTYNINNNINQNISSATPKQLADSTNREMINSVNAMRQQRGAL